MKLKGLMVERDTVRSRFKIYTVHGENLRGGERSIYRFSLNKILF
jgi:hypothetical protein